MRGLYFPPCVRAHSYAELSAQLSIWVKQHPELVLSSAKKLPHAEPLRLTAEGAGEKFVTLVAQGRGTVKVRVGSRRVGFRHLEIGVD